MPQELNKIWNAGKLFEPKPESEQPEKQPESEPNPSTVKRKKSVIGAFIDKQEDPFKEKVEAVLKGVEEKTPKVKKISEPLKKKEKPKDENIEETVIDGKGQNFIGTNLKAGEQIIVKGNAGESVGYNMEGGEVHVKGDAGVETGWCMTDGVLRIDGDVRSFHEYAFDADNKGTIIWKKQKIWENGQKVEPGWTNLKVEEKIAK
ncbi:MAG: hypothetical protein WC878_08145 [Candidatus Paceibacterota bacterium]|jgi:formylmethanofuran dehydrogenase subunit C